MTINDNYNILINLGNYVNKNQIHWLKIIIQKISLNFNNKELFFYFLTSNSVIYKNIHDLQIHFFTSLNTFILLEKECIHSNKFQCYLQLCIEYNDENILRAISDSQCKMVLIVLDNLYLDTFYKILFGNNNRSTKENELIFNLINHFFDIIFCPEHEKSDEFFFIKSLFSNIPVYPLLIENGYVDIHNELIFILPFQSFNIKNYFGPLIALIEKFYLENSDYKYTVILNLPFEKEKFLNEFSNFTFITDHNVTKLFINENKTLPEISLWKNILHTFTNKMIIPLFHSSNTICDSPEIIFFNSLRKEFNHLQLPLHSNISIKDIGSYYEAFNLSKANFILENYIKKIKRNDNCNFSIFIQKIFKNEIQLINTLPSEKGLKLLNTLQNNSKYINLDFAIDRNNHFKNEHNEFLEFFNIQRISGVHTQTINQEMKKTLTKQALDNIIQIFQGKSNTKHGKMSLGSYGCMMSHVKILQQFIDSDYSHIMIFEDDITIAKHLRKDKNSFYFEFMKIINSIFNYLDSDMAKKSKSIDLLYLGHSATSIASFSSIDHQRNFAIVRSNIVTGGYAYIISKAAAQYFLANLFPTTLQFDTIMSKLLSSNPNFNVFLVLKPLIESDDSFDINAKFKTSTQV